MKVNLKSIDEPATNPISQEGCVNLCAHFLTNDGLCDHIQEVTETNRDLPKAVVCGLYCGLGVSW